MLDLEVLVDLPEGGVVVFEEPLVDHLLFVFLAQVAKDFVGVTHPEEERLLERVHKVKVVGFVPTGEVLGNRIVAIMEDQAPGDLLLFTREADRRVELDADWNVPF